MPTTSLRIYLQINSAQMYNKFVGNFIIRIRILFANNVFIIVLGKMSILI